MSFPSTDHLATEPGSVTGKQLVFCFLGLAAAICGYSLWIGPVAFMGDSYLFADRAKHLFFQGNLNLNNHGTLVYPPLYSIFLAPCYALTDAARIVVGMTLLNSVLIASTVFPIYRLLAEYSQIAGKERWFLTLLITASPPFVTYAPMVMSEALFIPLVYWTTYAIFRSLRDLSIRWFVTGGLLMAVSLLSRSAATTLFLAGFFAWFVSFLFFTRIKPGRAIILLLSAAAAFAIPLLVWHWFEKHAVVYQGRTDYSIVNSLRELAASKSDQWIKLQWAANAVIYFMTAPLSLAAFLVVSTVASRFLLAARDPLVPFVAVSITLAIASIVVLAQTSYGGGPLTWNKYFAPYVGLIAIVAFRLRPHFTGKLFSAALGLAFILPWIGRPSGLSCHFPDALTPFLDSTPILPIPAWSRDVLFFILLVGTAPLLLPFGPRRGWYLGASVAAALSLMCAGVSARLWHNSGLLNLAHYDGLAVRLIEAQKQHPDIAVFYDPEIGQGDQGEALRLLFYYPRIISTLSRSTLLSAESTLPEHFLYLTRGMLPADLIATGWENIHLFNIDGKKIQKSLIYKMDYGQDVGGQEAIPFEGKRALVRWLGEHPELIFSMDEAVPKARIGLRIAAAGRPRTITGTFNGIVLPEKPLVSHVLWNGGFDYVEWVVPLRAGKNVLRLQNDSEPLPLPAGGMKATFLLIDEPLMLRP